MEIKAMQLKTHGIHEMKYTTSPKEKQGRVRIWEVKNICTVGLFNHVNDYASYK